MSNPSDAARPPFDPTHDGLPIHALHDAFESALADGPVVISSPTGSGKSTQVPRWCARQGRVLVIEPRRVACRSLAQWVASLERTPLGDGVGYSVRNEHRAGRQTSIVFATPGIVLRRLAGDDLGSIHTVIIDEFHERGLDIDLIVALLCHRFTGRLVVMSATLDGRRVAEHLSGRHLHAEGRSFPVDIRHRPGDALLPDPRGLDARVRAAVEGARHDPGDILVFLPGKGEIASARQALARVGDLDVLPLHGGLSLEEQSRAFQPTDRRKVILATNVAETSITLPGIGVVIDSGLVRRTRYHQGQGYLTRVPIAGDSADQRAGRAGRTRPGICYRLWSPAAHLQVATPPEIYRESLVSLVLAASACGERVESLPFLDVPKPHARSSARDELRALGALDDDARITERGRRLFGLPLNPSHGRLLIEAESANCLDEAIDLVAGLSVGRPLFATPPPTERSANSARGDLAHAGGDDDADPRAQGCDGMATIRAVRQKRPVIDAVNRFVVHEARRVASQLRAAFGLRPLGTDDGDLRAVEPHRLRQRLALAALHADPRCAHVARRRRGRLHWSNGGTEIELGRESAAYRLTTDERARVSGAPTDAIVVLGYRALGVGPRESKIIATHVMPVPLTWLVEAGLGRMRLAEVVRDGPRIVARMERVHARRVLETVEAVPEGALAVDAVVKLFLRGQLFPKTLPVTRERLEAAALYNHLVDHGYVKLRGSELAGAGPAYPPGSPVPELPAWTHDRVLSLGLESGDDLALLSPADLLAPDISAEARKRLEREFPRELSIGDAAYRLSYDARQHEVTLVKHRGNRKLPPTQSHLPKLRGFRVLLRDGQVVRVLRERA